MSTTYKKTEIIKPKYENVEPADLWKIHKTLNSLSEMLNYLSVCKDGDTINERSGRIQSQGYIEGSVVTCGEKGRCLPP